MLVAYGMPDEPEPGVLGAIAEHQIFALHLTSLNADGSGKADVQDGQSAKITIASPGGMPPFWRR